MNIYAVQDSTLRIADYASQRRFAKLLMAPVQCDDNGHAQEVIIKNGHLYVPVNYTPAPYVKPVAVFYKDRVCIQEYYDTHEVQYATLILTGQALLLKGGLPVQPCKDVLDTVRAEEIIPRAFLGIKQGRLHYLWDTCDIYTMQLRCYDLGYSEVLLLSFGKYAFFEYREKEEECRMGYTPITIAEALKVARVTNTIIAIDPGHGGAKPGAVSVHDKSVVEKDITLDMAKVVATHLATTYDCTPVLTRTTDVDVELGHRTSHANALKADYFWSIHVNAHVDPDARGYETLVATKASPRSKSIAAAFHKEAAKSCARYGLVDRRLKERDNLWVLNQSNMPAILTEVGFLSNREDLLLLKDRARLMSLYVQLADNYASAIGLNRRIAPAQEEMFRVTLTSLYPYAQACAHAETITKMGLPAIVEKLK